MATSPYSTEARLERIEQLLIDLVSEFRASRAQAQLSQESIMSEIDDLVAQVAAVKGVEDAAVLAINGLIDRLEAVVQSSTDLAELKAAVSAETALLRTNAVPLADAVAAVPPVSTP